jgi:hypothetical protein
MHPKRVTPFICFFVTLVLFLLCAIAHVSLFLNFNYPAHFPHLWLALHLSILTPFVIHAVYKHKPTFKGPAAYVEEPAFITYVATILIASLLFYAIFNFFYYGVFMHFGYPKIVDGEFVLWDHRNFVIKKLSAEEFPRYELYQARKVSGHWMLFHVLPLYGYYDWLTDRV